MISRTTLANLRVARWLAALTILISLTTLTACGGTEPAPADAPTAETTDGTVVTPDAGEGDDAGEEGSDDTAVAEEHTEADLISNVRQLIFAGERSGEGYFSADGKRLIYQSEREPENPFYQIYVLDLETGDTTRVSPGIGKTTCGWIHPDGEIALFASTHDDPEAPADMQTEIDFRNSGETRRYNWDYDKDYDIFSVSLEGERDEDGALVDAEYTNLTNALGYNAEGSYSPDGSQIAFASNRHAYVDGAVSPDLDEEAAELFELDPSSQMDIYIMDADGSNPQRLTDVEGYDGGPFFSPDGTRIVWRRFNLEGDKAEVWTMALDGSDAQQLTRLGAMSWAPYFHPSGEYIIFTTNLHGFGNFELYMVDPLGAKEPVRVTFTDGPDVLPVFSPDGERLAWSTRRGSDGKSQLTIADWDHDAALALLSAGAARGRASYGGGDVAVAAPDLAATTSDIAAADARLHVERLAAEEMGGRQTGTEGEAMATAYVAEVFEALGLAPAGDDGSYFQAFPFTSGVSLGNANVLSLQDDEGETIEPELALNADWRPIPFSKVGSVGFAPLVFAGYGIVAPDDGEQADYDSYADLDVAESWVVVLRYLPEDVDAERRQHLARYSSLRFKAMAARDRGAVGMIVVTGPAAEVKEELVPLDFDASVAGTSIAAATVSNAAAAAWFASTDTTLADAQAALDGGEEVAGFALSGVNAGAHFELSFDEGAGRNVVGRLQVGDAPRDEVVVIGAHVDHLGRGQGGDSLARSDEENEIHYGADDNASGVAGVIEIAQWFTDQAAAGELADLKRDVVFAAWSGEEMGLLGSSHYVKQLQDGDGDSIYPGVSAYLNMDMIGRLEDQLVIQGVASSPFWAEEIEKRNVVVGLPVSLGQDTYLPTDATSFYLRGVPILSAFTGAHEDYHSPRDTADKLDYEDLAQTARLVGLVARSAALLDAAPEYVEVAASGESTRRMGRVYLGTIPDYADTGVAGVLLSGVSTESPADEAGLEAGDIIVELAGQTLENLYDYTAVLDSLKIGEPAAIIVLRDGERLTLEIVPGSRE